MTASDSTPAATNGVARFATPYLSILKLGWPRALGMINNAVMQFVDRAYLEQYSMTALEAVLPAGTLAWIFMSFFQSVVGYSGVFVAQYHGAGDRAMCRACYRAALGIAGAAIASSVADAVCLIFFAVYSFRRVDRRRYQLFSGSPAGRGLHRELFVLGRWLMIQEAFAFLAWLIFFLAVEHLGETPLAVSNIVRQICSTLFLFIHGFGSACGAIASNLMGEDRPEDVPGVVRRGLVVCTASMLPLMGLIAVFPAATLSVFTSLNEVIEASEATLYVMLGSFAAAIPSMYLLFVMGGMGQTKESSVATMAAAVLYLVYIFAIVSVTDEVAVVWSADYIYYLTAGAVLLAYWRKGSWRTKRI